MSVLPLPVRVDRLVETALTSRAAKTSPALRRAVADHAAALSRNEPGPPPIPPDLQAYVRKVALHPYKVLDRDVEALRAAGYGVDEIFEITVCASIGASLERIERGLAAVEAAGAAPAMERS